MTTLAAFLIAKVPTKQAQFFLRALHSTGVAWDKADQPSCMDTGEPGVSVIMGWVQAPERILEFWEKSPKVRSLSNKGPPEALTAPKSSVFHSVASPLPASLNLAEPFELSEPERSSESPAQDTAAAAPAA